MCEAVGSGEHIHRCFQSVFPDHLRRERAIDQTPRSGGTRASRHVARVHTDAPPTRGELIEQNPVIAPDLQIGQGRLLAVKCRKNIGETNEVSNEAWDRR